MRKTLECSDNNCLELWGEYQYKMMIDFGHSTLDDASLQEEPIFVDGRHATNYQHMVLGYLLFRYTLRGLYDAHK